MNYPHLYSQIKVEVEEEEETATTDFEINNKWIQEDSPPQNTFVKIENPHQFAPQIGEPIELRKNHEEKSAEFESRPQGEDGHIIVHTGKDIRVTVKVHIPVDEHPNYNFVGKLLGPKGSTLQQLQAATQTRMIILGRGSMRDKQKEEEMRTQGDPKYSHLNEELHVEVTAFAPASEAYRRIAEALSELKHFLVPDIFDAPPQLDGEAEPPILGDAPPHMGLLLPPKTMSPSMTKCRGEPPLRGAMAQSPYTAPEGEVWAPPRPSPRCGGAAPPPTRATRRYDVPVNDYNSYGNGYGEYNSGNPASFYDYSNGNFAYGYTDGRGPMRTGRGGVARGRGNSRLQSPSNAGAVRRG